MLQDTNNSIIVAVQLDLFLSYFVFMDKIIII